MMPKFIFCNPLFNLLKISKIIYLFVFFTSFLYVNSYATTYYFSSTDGNDSYTSTQAQNSSTPWQSLSKASSFFSSLKPGDNILFKRGDYFYGSLITSVSGNSSARITIGAYGSGAKPLFSGFTNLQSWTNLGGGIWQCSIPSAKDNLNLVTINSNIQAMGRYPNADATNGGYLNAESANGSTSITDNQLTGSPNWTGADVVMRKDRWILDVCKINNHSGTTISYTNPSGSNYPGKANFGYFIQNDPKTLDQLGEWYYNKANKTFQMYFGSNAPSSYSVNASTVDGILNISNNAYITVDNIAIEGGNSYGVNVLNDNNITVQNCDINNSGTYGIYIGNTPNIVIDNNQVNGVLNNGIFVRNDNATPSTLTNNTIKSIGLLAGMGASGDGAYLGLYTSGNNFTIQNNNIDGIGYIALEFHGNNIVINNNYINNFCSVKDDGGGIYTYSGDGSITYTNRKITGNIVLNAIGARYGTDRPNDSQDARGIYLDQSSMNIDVTDNSVANCVGGGFYLNNIVNVNCLRNTVYNTRNAISLQRLPVGPLLRNNSFNQNILFPLNYNQTSFFYWNSNLYLPVVTDIQSDMRAMGTFDRNYYRNDVAAPLDFYYHTYLSGGSFIDPPPLNLDQWKPFINQDYNSNATPGIPKFKINSNITGNTVSNGTFTQGIGNVNFWSVNNNFSGSWDNTNKISGGSIKVTPYSSTNESAQIYAPIGSITAGKTYLLKITTLGTTVNGFFNLTLRQTNSPYSNLTTSQSRFFGTTAQTHEILITPTVSEANTSFLIEMQQSSGTAYFDNIEFYEVNATTIDVNTQVRFEYNPSTTNKIINLDGNYVGVDNTKYSGSVTLTPYTSKIFIRDTSSGTIVTPPAGSSLAANSTANSISCFGGSTTVNVSATGGTTPYTGTGSFAASSGKGSLKLSCSNPTANLTISTYWPIGTVTADKTYVLRFSVLGSNSSQVVKAYLRQSASPYTAITPVQTNTFGTTKTDYVFIFNQPVTTTDASFVIETPQNAGIVYIDNIAFFEGSSTGTLNSKNLYTPGDFENGIASLYTWSQNNVHLAEWDTNYKINGTNYYSVTDASGTVRTTGIVISQPLTALQASVTATGNTVTVNASGGTAPYTGTGNFTVAAGTYNYTVRDANGCTSTVGVTVTGGGTGTGGGSGTEPVVTATGNAISCFGGTTTVNVSATSVTAPYTGTGSFTASSGKGSLKLSCSNPVSYRSIYTYWTIGTVYAEKAYALRFSVVGSIDNQVVKAYLRQTQSPYLALTPVQTSTFGITKTDFVFIFNQPITTTDASFVIETPQGAGVVYIDNIAFFEASSTGTLTSKNLYTPGDFENGIASLYTWSENNVHLAEWDTNSKINGTSYYSVTDATGIVRTTGIVIKQPLAPLQASAAANGFTVTVSATGGTAPYTGTGNFTVAVGTYNYTVKDANGCTSTVAITVTGGSAGSGSSEAAITATANSISCFGGTTNVSVSATGGTAPYTGTGSFTASAGKGSLKLSCNNPLSYRSIYTYWTIGTVYAEKTYVLKFSVLGSIDNQVVKAYIRQTPSPYLALTPVQTSTFGTTKTDFVFIFNQPITTTDASFVIETPQGAGIVYIDNIAFFEVTSTGNLISKNLYTPGDFESGIASLYTWSENNVHLAEWDTNSKINGTNYYSITDATGAVRTTGIVIKQPLAPLQAFASASGNTVTVSATGGTPIYTGIGNFNVVAGTYNYTVRDANGCTSTATITTGVATKIASTATATTSVTTVAPIADVSLKVAISPNPATSVFNLIVEGGTAKNVNISVMSFDGKVLYKTVGSTNRKYTFGANFIPGIYTVLIRQGSTIQSVKLVKGKF